VLRPSPWAEPERDETTPQVIADWVGRHKHPRECAGGCRCERRWGHDAEQDVGLV